MSERRWRDLPDLEEVRAMMHGVLLIALLPVAFTLNLGPDIAERAEYSLNWFRRRLVRHVEHALGRDVELVMSFCWDPDGRLHVHGAIALYEGELSHFRAAARRAGGKWDNAQGEQFQLKSKLLRDHNWADYILDPHKQNCDPVPWTATRRLRGIAEKLHSEGRNRLI